MGVVMRNLAAPKLLVLIACMALLGVSGNASAAPLITNGSFEQGTFVGGSFGFPLAQQVLAGDLTTLLGWTATGELAWFASGQAGVTVVAGTHALDLTGFCDLGTNCGTAGAYGGVTQTVSTKIGDLYALSFLAGNYSLNTSQPTIVATVGGTPLSIPLPATTLASGVWDGTTITFIATTTSTVISFGGSGGAEGSTSYLGLDDVSLTDLSAVPLPAALPLFASGLGVLGLLGWRRKRKAAALAA